MSNVLCQIYGTKKLLLFPPHTIQHLSFPAGASSSTLDIFDTESAATSHALSQATPRYEAKLDAGDVLFVPALWLHAAAPTSGISVAVNVFFRGLAQGYAAGKDVYGNRDLQAYETGRRDVERMIKGLRKLPSEAGRFYAWRLAEEMRLAAQEWAGSGR